MNYKTKSSFKINTGFEVNADHIITAIFTTNQIISDLPNSLFRSIDYKTTSAVIGSIFCATLASLTDGIVNPIEKGHPDIIPLEGENASESQLRQYPQGLEIKCTVGNVTTGSKLRAGETRIDHLSAITWQAHHQEVKELLGLVWDFVDRNQKFNFPTITAAFYSNSLTITDWGAISGTTGRNTKVTGMTRSGKEKMGKGIIAIIDLENYLSKYKKLLGFPDF